MKSVKIVTVLAIVLVAITFLGVASAAEVTIGDEKFNIPDGFEEDAEGSEDIKDSTGTTYIKCYKNDQDDAIIINVVTVDDGSLTLEKLPGFKDASFNGIDGLFNKNTTEFEYVHDGKQIFVSAHDEDLLKEVLIKP